jgi:transcriptional regulator with XRE-family HTH domain
VADGIIGEIPQKRKRERSERLNGFLVLVGNRIRKLRLERGMNQDDFADSVGIQRAHIGLIENAKLEPRIGTYLKIADGLFVPFTELISEEVEQN